MLRAVVLSCTRLIVSVSVLMPVTRTISALAGVGRASTGQTDALKGGAGKRVPWPLATTSDVPELAGEGAVATVDTAKLV